MRGISVQATIRGAEQIEKNVAECAKAWAAKKNKIDWSEAEIKVGDIITDGLVNTEVTKVGQFQFGRMKIEGYRARIISPQGRGQETIINKEDAKLVTPK